MFQESIFSTIYNLLYNGLGYPMYLGGGALYAARASSQHPPLRVAAAQEDAAIRLQAMARGRLTRKEKQAVARAARKLQGRGKSSQVTESAAS